MILGIDTVVLILLLCIQIINLLRCLAVINDFRLTIAQTLVPKIQHDRFPKPSWLQFLNK